MEFKHLLFEKKGHIGIVTINRPPANSWSLSAIEELDRIMDIVEKDNDIRVVILTGAGEKCFSAGMDVADAGKSPNIGSRGRQVWRRVDRFEKPILPLSTAMPWAAGLSWPCAPISGSWPTRRRPNSDSLN